MLALSGTTAVLGRWAGVGLGLLPRPGAFVGALFGGASPAEDAQFQLVVLVGIELTTMVTGLVVTRPAG